MKKLYFILVAILGMATVANSQLRVISNGNVQIGDWTTKSSGLPGTLVGSMQVPDTLATMCVLGQQDKKSGGYISFGTRNQVSIGESIYTQLNPDASLVLKGKGGIEYSAGTSLIFKYTPPILLTAPPSFDYKINVSAPQYLTTSDVRKKKNIESLENLGGLLDNITPVSYQLTSETAKEGEAAKASSSSGQSHTQFGFIAQEVREIFPELVYEDEEGMLSIDYNGFIPLLVDALKNLKVTVSEQKELINSLTNPGAKQIKRESGIDDIINEEVITLSQNRPNPFHNSTEIACHVPSSVNTAFICIYDLNGRQMQQISIEERGDVTVTISGNSFPAGMYIYSLIADGKEVDTKRMILTE